ncbi:hypothetical protein V6Z12_D02G175900 [Gossypium hirsutum]
MVTYFLWQGTMMVNKEIHNNLIVSTVIRVGRSMWRPNPPQLKVMC